MGEERLLPVLPTAEEEEVAAGGPDGLLKADIQDVDRDAPPLATFLYGDHVSAVPVEVHHVGVEVVDGEFG